MREPLLDEFAERIFGRLNIPRAELDSLLAFVQERHYPRKSFLLHAGERWENLFYIHKGMIRLFYTDIEGRDFNKAFFWEGLCIWPVALRDRHDNVLFSVAALEESTILACPFQPLYDFLQQRGCWEKFALPFAEKLVEQKFMREHDLLLLSATQRYEQFAQTQPHIIHRIPDYHLASFLGMTNVSLSRIKRTAIQRSL
ncbi:MAG: Crp/Fnr family transcriptional regulator [Chloroflexota bacterium]